MKRDIVYIINRSEITAGTRGSSLGPGAVMTAARKQNKTFFGDYPLIEIKDVNHLLDQQTPFQFAKRIDGVVEVYQDLTAKISAVLNEAKFPLVLAADHGSAGGTIAGIKKAFPDSRLGVVWIDAHADIHTPYTTPSGNIHGMPLATALNEDNLPCKINQVVDETATLWEKLKNCGGIAPKILPEDLIFIGVRDTEEQENAIMERLSIRNFTVEEVRKSGCDLVFETIQDQLHDCDIIYISFDVDSMDPSLTSHGTGTPVGNGLSPEEARTFLSKFAQHKKTVCMEFVEVNPCLDEKTNTMAEVTAALFETVVEELKK